MSHYMVAETLQAHSIRMLPDKIMIPNSPIESSQVIQVGGVMKARTLVTSKDTINYKDCAIVGKDLAASWKKHVLLWISNDGSAVMLAVDNLNQVKPLKDLEIMSNEIPERLRGEDIVCNTPPIYIGSTDKKSMRKIRRMINVERLIHVSPGSWKDWRFNNWMVAFEGEKSRMKIFPESGDLFLSFDLVGNEKQEAMIKSFYQNYSRFIKNNGVIGISFMRDASKLTKEEMRLRFPRDELYREDPEIQIEYVKKLTGIKLTPEQKALYYNLRWIPSDVPLVTYDVGYIEPRSERYSRKTKYLHPSQLDVIGLLSQIFKFTEDITKESLLEKYCQRFIRSADTYEID